MPHRPKSILFFTLIYALSPVFILVQAAVMARLPLFGRISIIARLSAGDLCALALYIVCAISIFSVRRWGWYLFMVASLALVALNIRVAFMDQNRSSLVLALIYDAVLMGAAGFFFQAEPYRPVFQPAAPLVGNRASLRGPQLRADRQGPFAILREHSRYLRIGLFRPGRAQARRRERVSRGASLFRRGHSP